MLGLLVYALLYPVSIADACSVSRGMYFVISHIPLELKIVTALSMIQPEIGSVSIMFEIFYMKNAINRLLFHHIQVSALGMESTKVMLQTT